MKFYFEKAFEIVFSKMAAIIVPSLLVRLSKKIGIILQVII